MIISNLDKAKVLTQALPYIQQYNKKTIVVKYGGNAMINEKLKEAVISDLILLSHAGINVVLVHGGGPEITDMMKKLNIEAKFINGLRYTDEETIDIVQMVLAGKTNKDLVNLIGLRGGSAVGLSGLDGGMIKARKLIDSAGENDYGYVGEITDINIKPVEDLLEKGYIPVVATIAQATDREYKFKIEADKAGIGRKRSGVYNINADTAACEIAVKLKAEKLILLTDVKGVMTDIKDQDTLIPVVKIAEVADLKQKGVITGGMLPKVDCCVASIEGGVNRTHIIDGRIQHSILIELLSDEGIGTMFIR
ncbi:MAG: acetylglutamate kinase [Oscillospiraceae bacterium]|nr:acetylglutamate kinase [Oscillospiraceae bacterium]